MTSYAVMTHLSIREIKARTNSIVWRMGASPRRIYVTFDSSDEMATPFISIDESGYHWIISERGVVRETNTTHDPKQLFYWISCQIAFSVAADYELRMRTSLIRRFFYPLPSNYDCRRIIFQKKLELLQKIDPDYREWQQRELMNILEKHPFTDGLPNVL